MRRSHVFCAIAAVAAVLLLVAPARAQQAKIGAIRFTKVVKSYQRFIDEQDARKARSEEFENQAKAKLDEINQLQQKLQQHTPDSDAYKTTQDELRTKTREFQIWRQLKSEEIMMQEVSFFRQLYLDIETETINYARENHFLIVFKEDELDASKARVENLDIQVATKKILYIDPSIDISDAVIERLNKAYAAAKAAENK